VTSNVRALADGEGQPSCFLTPKGKILAAFHLYRQSEEDFLAVFGGPVPAEARRSLERYAVLDDIAIADEGEARRMLTIQGPRAFDCLRGAHFHVGDVRRPYWQRFRCQFDDVEVFVRSECRSVEIGVTVEVPVEFFEAAWQSLVSSAVRLDGGPVGWSTEESLLGHAGIPRWGVDFDGSNFPNECGWDPAISYKKGCYIGQEGIARMRTYGHVNRKLVQVRFPYRPGVERDARLYHNGKEVGRITSVAKLPTTTIRTALAYVRQEAWEPNTPVAIGSPEAPADAKVALLPLIDPDAPGQEQER